MPLFARPALTKPLGPIEQEVLSLSHSGKSEEFVLIVPNRIAQRRLEREMVERATGRAIAKPNILTLADLAQQMCAVAFRDLRLISDAKAAILVEQSIRELLGKHQLSYFERATESDIPSQAFPIPRGTFELVVNTIRRLKENGITVEDIEAELTSSNGEESTEFRRATDICEIYRAYHSKLVGGKFMDTYGQTLLLNERYKTLPIEVDFRAVFPNVSRIFFDGFYYLETPTLKLLQSIGKMPSLQTIIALDYRGDNPELFSGVLELREKLFEQGFAESNEKPSTRTKDDLNALLRRHLFAMGEQGYERQTAPQISYFEAIDPLAEVEELAQRVKLLAAAPTVDISRIVIGVPAIEDYSMMVQEIFGRCGIPVEIADRERLDRAPLFLALISLFDLVRPSPRLRNVLQALGSPYFDFRSGGDALDVQNLLSVLMREKPSGDLGGWLRSLQMRLDTLQDDARETTDDEELRHFEREIREIAQAMRDLSRVRAVLAPFDANMTPAGFVNTLRDVMQRLRLRENLLAQSAQTIAGKQLEHDAAAFRALTRLVEELGSLFRLLGIGDDERRVSFYVERLKAASIYTRFNIRVRASAVLVAPLSQAIASPADHLFVAGLVEGALPRAYQPQVFLTQKQQHGGEEKQLREDRVLFYQAVTHASRVTLSAPKRSISGAEISRSIFLDALKEKIVWQELEPVEGLFSWRDLHERVGKIAASDQKWQKQVATIANNEQLLTHLPHVLEMEATRAQTAESRYAGTLDLAALTERERAMLEKAKTRVWSVTQLELYAACPFKYFADRVLKLGQDEEREEGLDARDRGSLLHEILRDFMTQRREQKRDALHVLGDSELNDAYRELRETAERHFAEAEREHPLRAEHPFWRLDRERLLEEEGGQENVLRRFVKRERELAPYAQHPAFFEVSFGLATKPNECDPMLSQSEPIEIDGVKFKGRIDRIDLDDRTYSIIDYKTGDPVKFRAIDKGISLQLPLYIRIADDLLSSQFPEVRGVAALYHQISKPGSPRALGLALKEEMGRAFEELGTRADGIIKSEEQLQELITKTINYAKAYVDGIANGRFPLPSLERTKTSCTYCSYGAACRVSEAKDLGVLSAE